MRRLKCKMLEKPTSKIVPVFYLICRFPLSIVLTRGVDHRYYAAGIYLCSVIERVVSPVIALIIGNSSPRSQKRLKKEISFRKSPTTFIWHKSLTEVSKFYHRQKSCDKFTADSKTDNHRFTTGFLSVTGTKSVVSSVVNLSQDFSLW